MRQLANFNGTLCVNVKQTDKNENSYEMNLRIEGFRTLGLNQLVGTLTNEVFQQIDARRVAGIKDFVAKAPVVIRMTDGEGHVIADTAILTRDFQARLTFASKQSFGRALYMGLAMLDKPVQVVNLTKLIKDDSVRIKVAAADQVLHIGEGETTDALVTDNANIIAQSVASLTAKRAEAKKNAAINKMKAKAESITALKASEATK